jgi:hypothetical protein
MMTNLLVVCESNDAKRICIGNQLGLLPFRFSRAFEHRDRPQEEILGSSTGLQRLAV